MANLPLLFPPRTGDRLGQCSDLLLHCQRDPRHPEVSAQGRQEREIQGVPSVLFHLCLHWSFLDLWVHKYLAWRLPNPADGHLGALLSAHTLARILDLHFLLREW